MQEPPLCCTTSVAVGTRAFNNYNGIGISLCYSPQPPSAVQQATASWSSIAQGSDPAQMQPPPMLAVVLDTSMARSCLESAVQSLTQALLQLKPQTRLLLIVVDQVVSMLDLKSSKPQFWVVHGAAGPGAAVLPQIVRAADVRATPLAHCEHFIAQSLAAIRHYPRQQSLQHHLQIVTAAVDIALFLLTASMAAWDTQNRHQPQPTSSSAAQAQQQQQQRSTGPGTAEQPMVPRPMHNAKVMLLTALPSSSTASQGAAVQLLQQMELAGQQQLQQMVGALAGKAASLDIPIHVISGSLAAPAALLLQEAVSVSHGRLLHQPQLAPPLASNIVALAQSRFGWEGVIDVRVPAGVRVVQLFGPVAPTSALPPPAYLSGTPELPVLLVGSPKAATAAAAVKEAAAAAAVKDAATDGTIPTGAAAATDHSSGSTTAAQQQPRAAGSDQPAVAETPAASSGPISWSSAATAVPVVSGGTRFVAVLELSQDWSPGSSLEVQVVCEWTAVDGRRTRQVCTHKIQVSDRAFSFLDGLDVPAVVLMMAQRLVFGAAAAAAPATSAGISLQQLAAVPKSKGLEEGRISVGMALAHIAQRLGHAHTAKKGILGFGSQLVYELPEELIPLALSLYQLQRSNLLNPNLTVAEPWEQLLRTLDPSDASAAATMKQHHSRTGTEGLSSSLAMYGSWRMAIQQFMQAAPSSALRMVAPWLYVYDRSSGQFEVLPPLNLALEPDALAVLDCGSEVIIYVGSILEALVEGSIPDSRSSKQQGDLQAVEAAAQDSAAPDLAASAAVQAANGVQAPGKLAAAAAGEGSTTASTPSGAAPAAAPDMAMAAAPAVRCAQQLVHGRVPVPGIKLVEDPGDMVQLVKRLVPLHSDPVALQLLLLPHLRDLTPAQHGYLLDWHRHWAAAAHEAGSVSAAGGARLAYKEVAGELSFGQWYSSFGVVLRSPSGTMGSDGVAMD